MQREQKYSQGKEYEVLTYLIEAEAFSGSVPGKGLDEVVELFACISELGQIFA
jgi:hypothetical protein